MVSFPRPPRHARALPLVLFPPEMPPDIPFPMVRPPDTYSLYACCFCSFIPPPPQDVIRVHCGERGVVHFWRDSLYFLSYTPFLLPEGHTLRHKPLPPGLLAESIGVAPIASVSSSPVCTALPFCTCDFLVVVYDRSDLGFLHS